MHYTFDQRVALMIDPFLKETTNHGIDPITYAMDLFFIDNWLTKNLYPQLDDLQGHLHWRTRMDFAVLLLSKYLSSPDINFDFTTNHFDVLERFLYERSPDCMDSDEEGSLVDILAGM